MLLKSFKKYFSDTKFRVTVHNKKENTYESFNVDYIATENDNVGKITTLYDKKATVKHIHYNKAYELNEIWVEV